MDVRCQSLNEFKRLYNFYFRISAFYFGKQSIQSLLISRGKNRFPIYDSEIARKRYEKCAISHEIQLFKINQMAMVRKPP